MQKFIRLIFYRKHLVVLGALALFFGARASAQEWTYTSDYDPNNEVGIWYRDAWQKQDGGVIVSGCETSIYSGTQPVLTSLSPNGNELGRKTFGKPAFCAVWPQVVFNGEGETFALMAYHPDYDSCTTNYFLNFDNPPDHAILGLYKLDEQLNILESHEHTFAVDTAICPHQSCHPNSFSGRITLISAEADGNFIVGSYVISPTYDLYNPRGHDSIFFFRMDFEGQFIDRVGYEMESIGGSMYANWLYYQFVKVDNGFIFYYNDFPRIHYTAPDGLEKIGTPGTAYSMDKDFHIFEEKAFHQQAEISPIVGDCFQQMSVVRSHNNSVYVTSAYTKPSGYGQQGIALYEYHDSERDGTLPMLRYTERSSGLTTWDKPATAKGVDLAADNTIFFGYVLRPDYSVLCIDRLTPDFDSIRTWTFGEGENYVINLYTIRATEDGGLLAVYRSNLYGSAIGHYVVAKIPAEDFVGIGEAHANGQKEAIVYPNPGKNVLNIRTGLQNARVEVYDLNGRLVHGQEMTESHTTIDAEAWAEGVYVWKVIANDKEVERGKWIKE